MEFGAAFAALPTLASQLSTLASLANDTANNITDKWYQDSADISEFKEMQTKLQQKRKDWTDALRSAGMSDEPLLKEALNHAIQCLEAEKIKTDTLQSNCCGFFRFMFPAKPFPPALKESMKKVIDEFDNIYIAYEERNEPARRLEMIADSRPDPYHITVDPRIVSLAETHDKVMEHLNDKAKNQVVTLYGGPGSGKTSLAKLVAYHYQETKTVFSDGARFISCGHNATVDSVCKELFQSLGISDVNADTAPDAKAEHETFKAKGTPSEPGQSPSVSLLKKLPRRLKERSLLIILDDVSDPEILKEKLVVPHARDVKYLITSQERNVCDGATMIHMDPPSREEAMRIFGNYVLTGEIPDNLEDEANQIIEKADYHPMTLATIGRQIDNTDSWKEVLKNFNALLASGDMLAASLGMAIDAVGANSNAQQLLYLVAMCEPLYVPEVILQLLFQHINPEHMSTFKMLGKNLKDRDLVVIDEDKDWILQSTYQYFILKNKKEDVSKLLYALLKEDNNDDDHELVRALCVLYIESKKDVPFTLEASLAMESAAKEFNISLKDQNMILNMREAIGPLLGLLFPSKDGEECEMRRHDLASEAIKRFISKQDLDDDSFAQLLMEEDIYENICTALVRMTAVQKEDSSLLTKDGPFILDELKFNLLPSSKEIITTINTLSALSHAANCDFILADDQVLKNLLRILHSGDKNKQSSTLSCLGALAQSSTARKMIASYEGLIKAVVAIFYMESDIMEEDNMMVKVLSINALANIALQENTSAKLVKTPDLLTSMARFLEDIYSKDPEFTFGMGQLGAKFTIECLLSLLKGNGNNKGDIIEHEDLMHVLTRIFEKQNERNPSKGDEVAEVALQVLTIIDPEKYNQVELHSEDAYIARGYSNAFCGLYMEAYNDYKRADRLDNSNDSFYKTKLCFFKAMLKDYNGAFAYAKWALKQQPNNPYLLQECGVVKELMGDYVGAKIDFNKSLATKSNDYEVLKHRAYVNFKLGCEEEAHADAKKALEVIPKYRIDKRDNGQAGCLGVLSVPNFLDYDLK